MFTRKRLQLARGSGRYNIYVFEKEDPRGLSVSFLGSIHVHVYDHYNYIHYNYEHYVFPFPTFVLKLHTL